VVFSGFGRKKWMKDLTARGVIARTGLLYVWKKKGLKALLYIYIFCDNIY